MKAITSALALATLSLGGCIAVSKVSAGATADGGTLNNSGAIPFGQRQLARDVANKHCKAFGKVAVFDTSEIAHRATFRCVARTP